MDKKQVIALLGKSDRMVSKYVAQGLLTPTYQKGPTSDKAVYDEAQVRQLKETLDGRAGSRERVKPEPVNVAPLNSEQRTGNSEPGTVNSERGTGNTEQRTPNSVSALVPMRGLNTEPLNSGVSVFMLTQEQPEQLVPKADVSLRDKLVLKFAEAAKVSGFPEARLREAARDNQLKAIKVGRGQCVHRDDLVAWVKKQFE